MFVLLDFEVYILVITLDLDFLLCSVESRIEHEVRATILSPKKIWMIYGYTEFCELISERINIRLISERTDRQRVSQSGRQERAMQ